MRKYLLIISIVVIILTGCNTKNCNHDWKMVSKLTGYDNSYSIYCPKCEDTDKMTYEQYINYLLKQQIKIEYYQ